MPTWQGTVFIFLLIGGLTFSAIRHLYPFLAQNHPLPHAEMIIVEGWVADDELKEAVKDIRPGQIIVTTGGPVTFGQKILNYESYAEIATARLIAMGIPASSIVTVPAPDTLRDRTYVSALATRRKLEELGLFGKPANLYTVGAHARRSHLLFQNVFGKNYPLGVVAVSPPNYHLERWYSHSAGFKHVLTEFISWIYAKFFLIAHV